MKHPFNTLLLVFALAFLPSLKLIAQCEPDTVNCKDTGDPGQICPPNMPPAVVNELYDEVITVIAPDTATVGEVQIGIAYIEVDSVKNLPPGIEYHANAEKFYPDSAYCIQITGTPTEAGEYALVIYVSPFIHYLNQIVKGTQVVDDSSVVITVNETSGLDPYKINDFQVLPTAPNPFSEVTRLGFYTPFDDHIKLQVYNILGRLMHEEMQGAPPGEHYFNFNGSTLNPGTYFYRITNSSELYTGKFIKSR
ncbi:MAG: T9SS type A sorting domain-containing protein [Bacteroidota bacterium]